ncbi:NUDIX domain-containing protein [Pannonibacter tanglangensis]|uniref:GDP-mannose pyrophosphatase n=1 Tax=Pannonibacter tanglangensis TaxID=2750084 RepID=A0ABW9ZKJ3_9HYPH|nr:NUDIX hydrolase [Pannonibacter sp. XCT-34]NBN64573.1 NUDIX domain-containing protein [Pannonibacter sp. XCT-34]
MSKPSVPPAASLAGDAAGIEILSRREVYRGRATVEEVTLRQRRRDGGHQEITREIVRYGRNVVAVLPLDLERGCLLLCRQLRVPMLVDQGDPRPFEVCAGRLEEGEDAADGARRELLEEFGVAALSLTPVMVCYTSPGILGARADLFLAGYDGAARAAGGGLLAEGEDIEVLEVGFAEAARLLAEGRLRDAKSVILLQHLMLRHPDRFGPLAGP